MHNPKVFFMVLYGVFLSVACAMLLWTLWKCRR